MWRENGRVIEGLEREKETERGQWWWWLRDVEEGSRQGHGCGRISERKCEG